MGKDLQLTYLFFWSGWSMDSQGIPRSWRLGCSNEVGGRGKLRGGEDLRDPVKMGPGVQGASAGILFRARDEIGGLDLEERGDLICS